jgi:hypothetical protein
MGNRHTSGSALVIALAIGMLLAIQIYIVMVYSSGGFRHTEKVTGHLRAIFIGESSFAQVLARLRAGRWEDRWFKAGPVQDVMSMAGGSCLSYVSTATTSPAKQVNVWLEAHYETATALMYYQVLCVDDGLDFTAQMYPNFFTFLQDGDPTPLGGPLSASVSLIQSEILEQQKNLPKALAALDSVKGTNGLQALGNTLNVPFVAPPLDTTQPFDAAPAPQADYVASVQTTNDAAPPAPAPAPTPAPPAPGPTDVQNIMAVIQGQFQTATGMLLPLNGSAPNGPGWNDYFKGGSGKNSWRSAYNHYTGGYAFASYAGGDLGGPSKFIQELGQSYDDSPVAPTGVKIQNFMLGLLTWFKGQTDAKALAEGVPGPNATTVNVVTPYNGKKFHDAYRAYVNWWSVYTP